MSSPPATVPSSDTVTSTGPSATAVDKPEEASSSDVPIKQWVDYLPHHRTYSHDEEDTKQTSIDVTESHLTDNPDHNIEEDWYSLDGGVGADTDMMVVPHVLLIENDPKLQHELLLEDHHHHPNETADHAANSNDNHTSGAAAVDVSTQQRLLYERMKASWQTRRMLRPHIRQRAGLAGVLKSIEDSSVTLRRHVLRGAASSSSSSHHRATTTVITATDPTPAKNDDDNDKNHNNNKDDDDDDMICDDLEDQEMLVSALTQDDDDVDNAVAPDDEDDAELAGLDEGVIVTHDSTSDDDSSIHGDNHHTPNDNHDDDDMVVDEGDIAYTYMRNHDYENDPNMPMTTIAEEELPEPLDLTQEDIDKVDFFWLVRNEQEHKLYQESSSDDMAWR